MVRFLAGAAACFLLLTGAFFIWQSRAEPGPGLPAAPKPRAPSSYFSAAAPLQAPEADPKTREERRFSRADKNKDGKIDRDEGEDIDGFNFSAADADDSRWVSRAEFQTAMAGSRPRG